MVAMNVLTKLTEERSFSRRLLEVVWSSNATEADSALSLPPPLYQSSDSGYLKLRKTDTEGRKSKQEPQLRSNLGIELGSWLPQKAAH